MKQTIRSTGCVWQAAVWLIAAAMLSELALAQPQGFGRGRGFNAAADEPRGLRINTDAATPGYTLFTPLTSDTTYLIDNAGRVLRTWQSDFIASAWVYMLDDGSILRGGTEPETFGFSGGGQSGRFQRFSFDGELLWDFSFNNAMHLPHHDVAVLPNGNIVAVVWEAKTPAQARQAGRLEEVIPERGLWPDTLIEFQPLPPNDARIVWQWRSWDHLVQHVDAALDNYGDPAVHPERIDINGDRAGATTVPTNPSSDIFHINAVAYHAGLDQLIVSSPTYNELWVIDHSTTTEEAAGHTGGRAGMGGDLLYRWGNPQAYGRGDAADRQLGFNHDTRWIPAGMPGAGNIMVFSNQSPGPNGSFTRVIELVPPLGTDGRYVIQDDLPFGPREAAWSYAAPDTFSATYISGATRLSSGNTLITSGPQGRLFEVDPTGRIVWEYWSPFSGRAQAGPNAGRNPWAVFRAVKIAIDHPGLAGRGLLPMAPPPPLESPAP